jgi:hypothetical protein
MIQIQEDLVRRIQTLEKELQVALEEKERAFRYRWAKGRAVFEQEILAQHRKLKSGLFGYFIKSRVLVVLTAPIIYLGLIPFALLDLFLALYQATFVRACGIPRVRRADYLIFDRGSLKYLNFLERLHCAYCSYANGLCAYATEITARTEQHWCPIKHAHRLRSPHSRYSHFLDYGNADSYVYQIENVRRDFKDLKDAE